MITAIIIDGDTGESVTVPATLSVKNDAATQAYLDGIAEHEKAMQAYLSGKLEHPNILSNYRFAFKSQHSQRWQGSDETLTGIIRDIGPCGSSAEQDEAVLKEMFSLNNL